MEFLAIDGSALIIPAERIYSIMACSAALQKRRRFGISGIRGLDLKKELHKRIFNGKSSRQYVEIFYDEASRLDSDAILTCEECLDKTRTNRFFLVDLPRIWTNYYSYLCVSADGKLKAWGKLDSGGDCSSVSDSLDNDVREIFSNRRSYCAIRDTDGALFAWGNRDSGGDCSSVHSQLSGDIATIYSSAEAFVAIRKSDGSLFGWGNPNFGGDCTAVAEQLNGDIASIHSCARGFVAIRKTMYFSFSGAAQIYVRAPLRYVIAMNILLNFIFTQPHMYTTSHLLSLTFTQSHIYSASHLLSLTGARLISR